VGRRIRKEKGHATLLKRKKNIKNKKKVRRIKKKRRKEKGHGPSQ
jgi:hypothetical protein